MGKFRKEIVGKTMGGCHPEEEGDTRCFLTSESSSLMRERDEDAHGRVPQGYTPREGRREGTDQRKSGAEGHMEMKDRPPEECV